MKLLLKAGAKFNTTEKDINLMIPNSLINQFNSSSSFINSSILTRDDGISLTQMLNYPTEVKLIYRATRDGFNASSFHSKCDKISNTVTIIKTTSNSVFGGFTSATWKHYNEYIYDENAFIFSLRRLGNKNKLRFNVTSPNNAIFGYYYYGPIFGGGHDIHVSDNSNQNNDSFSNLGSSYQLPSNIAHGSYEARSYLAGSYNWQTTEIEVYQLTQFLPYTVPPLHNGWSISHLFLNSYILQFNL